MRQDGYQDFTQKILVQPGQKEVVRVAMEKAPTGPLPRVSATVMRKIIEHGLDEGGPLFAQPSRQTSSARKR